MEQDKPPSSARDPLFCAEDHHVHCKDMYSKGRYTSKLSL
jgi:hypothetical protein